MIKGRKIQRQSINLIVPIKNTIKSHEIKNKQPHLDTKNICEAAQRIEETKKQQPLLQRTGENIQITTNKEDSSKQALKQTVNNNKQSKQKDTKSEKQVKRSTEKASNSSCVNSKKQNTQKQSKKQGQKVNKNYKRTTKQKIQQIMKQQEAIRKALIKPIKTQSKNKQQNNQKNVKDTQIYVSTSGLTQQKQMLFSDQDEPEEQQRQFLPNPINQISFQQEQVDFNVQSNTKFIEYEDSSFQEQAFSFLPQKQSPQKQQAADLPINMDLFELTADQLLALDYFPI